MKGKTHPLNSSKFIWKKIASTERLRRKRLGAYSFNKALEKCLPCSATQVLRGHCNPGPSEPDDTLSWEQIVVSGHMEPFLQAFGKSSRP